MQISVFDMIENVEKEKNTGYQLVNADYFQKLSRSFTLYHTIPSFNNPEREDF